MDMRRLHLPFFVTQRPCDTWTSAFPFFKIIEHHGMTEHHQPIIVPRTPLSSKETSQPPPTPVPCAHSSTSNPNITRTNVLGKIATT